MNCDKLSLDACLHAAKNDRLPLRTIVQVLFSEQVKMRMMMQDKQPETEEENPEGRDDRRISRDNEIRTLKGELESVKKKMEELQNDYNELQQEYEKLSSSKQMSTQTWGLRWQKMKKLFQIKREDDETRDRPRRRSSTGPRTSFRRMSMS